MPAELALGIAAAVAACLALGLLFWVWVKLKRLRAAQSVLLGGGKSDLVDFAVSLQGRIDDLHGAVDELAAALSRVDRRVDGAVSNTAVVRYDPIEGAGGHHPAPRRGGAPAATSRRRSPSSTRTGRGRS